MTYKDIQIGGARGGGKTGTFFAESAPPLDALAPGLAELRDAAARIVRLIDDPHPGLMTWCEALGREIARVDQFHTPSEDQ